MSYPNPSSEQQALYQYIMRKAPISREASLTPYEFAGAASDRYWVATTQLHGGAANAFLTLSLPELSNRVFLGISDDFPHTFAELIGSFNAESECNDALRVGYAELIDSPLLKQYGWDGIVMSEPKQLIENFPNTATIDGEEHEFILLTLITRTEYDLWRRQGYQALMERFEQQRRDIFHFHQKNVGDRRVVQRPASEEAPETLGEELPPQAVSHSIAPQPMKVAHAAAASAHTHQTLAPTLQPPQRITQQRKAAMRPAATKHAAAKQAPAQHASAYIAPGNAPRQVAPRQAAPRQAYTMPHGAVSPGQVAHQQTLHKLASHKQAVTPTPHHQAPHYPHPRNDQAQAQKPHHRPVDTTPATSDIPRDPMRINLEVEPTEEFRNSLMDKTPAQPRRPAQQQAPQQKLPQPRPHQAARQSNGATQPPSAPKTNHHPERPQPNGNPHRNNPTQRAPQEEQASPTQNATHSVRHKPDADAPPTASKASKTSKPNHKANASRRAAQFDALEQAERSDWEDALLLLSDANDLSTYEQSLLDLSYEATPHQQNRRRWQVIGETALGTVLLTGGLFATLFFMDSQIPVATVFPGVFAVAGLVTLVSAFKDALGLENRTETRYSVAHRHQAHPAALSTKR